MYLKRFSVRVEESLERSMLDTRRVTLYVTLRKKVFTVPFIKEFFASREIKCISADLSEIPTEIRSYKGVVLYLLDKYFSARKELSKDILVRRLQNNKPR